MLDLELEQNLMASAYLLALNSPDPSTQNGAVIWNGVVIGEGWNDFPPGVHPVFTRPEKYARIEHAERNAIADVGPGRIKPGSTMYALWAACADCARAIITAGITEVVTHGFYDGRGSDDWLESIRIADEMFDEAGVTKRSLFVPLGPIRFQGEVVTP